MTHYEGKVVIVGGNLGKMKGEEFTKGIGALIAERIASHGGKVVVTDIDQKVVDACAKAINVKGIWKDVLKDRKGHEVTKEHPYKKDAEGKPEKVTDMVWDDSGADEIVRDTIQEFGKVDILINNWDSFDGAMIDKTTSEQFDALAMKNIAPVFHFCAAVRNPFSDLHTKDPKSWGKVVNVFSFVGKCGLSMGSVYSGFMGSLVALTKGLAREFGRFAIVNGVCYGPLEEKKSQGPEGKERNIAAYLLTSSDYGQKSQTNFAKVVNVVEFIASDAANGICGQNISVDGGLWLKLEI